MPSSRATIVLTGPKKLYPATVSLHRLLARAFCIVLALSLCAACSRSPQEKLIEKAFAAIQKNDLEAFQKITVTLADFELKGKKGGPFAKTQRYAGNMLKPEQVQALQDQFKRAAAGGPGCIDFTNSQFIGLGASHEISKEPQLAGDPVPCTVYGLKIKSAGAETDTRDLDPQFAVTAWGDQYRIIELVFRK